MYAATVVVRDKLWLTFQKDIIGYKLTIKWTQLRLHGISECLNNFASWSGLHMNTTKTELFTSRVDQAESAAIASYEFFSGQFPIRYLGLPLMSRKVKISEYAPLMLKITSKLQSWTSKILSFAGRLQLLRTVIFGLVAFWLSAFILPKGCIKSIGTLCSSSFGLET